MRYSPWALWLQQSVVCLALLRASGACCRLYRAPRKRLLAAAALCGALCAVGTVCPFASLRLAFCLPVLPAPCLCWPSLPRALRRRLLCAHFLLGLFFAGLARWLFPLLPQPLLLPCACLIVLLLPHFLSRHPDVPSAQLYISCGEYSVSLTALVDSGNLLRDSLTGLPVVVISRRAAIRLHLAPDDQSLLPGMRFLPIRTASGSGLMVICRPDRLLLTHEGQTLPLEAMLGISPDADAGFSALMPASLLPLQSNIPSTTRRLQL